MKNLLKIGSIVTAILLLAILVATISKMVVISELSKPEIFKYVSDIPSNEKVVFYEEFEEDRVWKNYIDSIRKVNSIELDPLVKDSFYDMFNFPTDPLPYYYDSLRFSYEPESVRDEWSKWKETDEGKKYYSRENLNKRNRAKLLEKIKHNRRMFDKMCMVQNARDLIDMSDDLKMLLMMGIVNVGMGENSVKMLQEFVSLIDVKKTSIKIGEKTIKYYVVKDILDTTDRTVYYVEGDKIVNIEKIK